MCISLEIKYVTDYTCQTRSRGTEFCPLPPLLLLDIVQRTLYVPKILLGIPAQASSLVC